MAAGQQLQQSRACSCIGWDLSHPYHSTYVGTYRGLRSRTRGGEAVNPRTMSDSALYMLQVAASPTPDMVQSSPSLCPFVALPSCHPAVLLLRIAHPSRPCSAKLLTQAPSPISPLIVFPLLRV